jgi:hypothetical protein
MFNRLTLSLTLLVAAGLGTAAVLNANAAHHSPSTGGSQQLYLTPASSTLRAGSTITVQIRENSGTTPVNAVQANFAYPADMLQFGSISSNGTAFGVEAQADNLAGIVRIARGSTNPVTGDQLVATVTFTSKAAHGTANLAFTPESALITSVTNSNLLTSTGSASYRLSK